MNAALEKHGIHVICNGRGVIGIKSPVFRN